MTFFLLINLDTFLKNFHSIWKWSTLIELEIMLLNIFLLFNLLTDDIFITHQSKIIYCKQTKVNIKELNINSKMLQDVKKNLVSGLRNKRFVDTINQIDSSVITSFKSCHTAILNPGVCLNVWNGLIRIYSFSDSSYRNLCSLKCKFDFRGHFIKRYWYFA